MKNSGFVLTALCLLLFMGYSPMDADAQVPTTEGDISVGAGVGFGSSVGGWGGNEPGLQLNGFYTITDDIRAGAGFIYYLVDQSDFSSTEFNIDGHYLFQQEDEMILYGVGGISIGTYSWDTGVGSVSSSATGLNLGGGIEYNVGPVLLFAEPKVTVGGFGQFNVTGGARMRL